MPSGIASALERPKATPEGRGSKRGESRGSRPDPTAKKSNTLHPADEPHVRGMTGKGRRHGPPAVHPLGTTSTRQDGDSEIQRPNILS